MPNEMTSTFFAQIFLDWTNRTSDDKFFSEKFEVGTYVWWVAGCMGDADRAGP